jgi:hypothetical protein
MKCPVTIHEFSLATDGWAASHCQIGGPEAASAVIFDWLDKVVVRGLRLEPAEFDTRLMNKYFHGRELDQLAEGICCSTI